MSIEQCKQCLGEGEYYTDGECYECLACKPHKRSEQPDEYASATTARKAELDAITAESICADLTEACNGHPYAKIKWPHYLLHNAAYFIKKQHMMIVRQPEREAVVDKELKAVLQTGWELSTWAGSINWRGGENQTEWLNDLRTLIERFQDQSRAYVATNPAGDWRRG